MQDHARRTKGFAARRVLSPHLGDDGLRRVRVGAVGAYQFEGRHHVARVGVLHQAACERALAEQLASWRTNEDLRTAVSGSMVFVRTTSEDGLMFTRLTLCLPDTIDPRAAGDVSGDPTREHPAGPLSIRGRAAAVPLAAPRGD